jgi:hypothetical protein
MKQFIFYVNLILTIIAGFIIALSYLITNNEDGGIIPLFILGFYQVVTAFGLTGYIAFNDLKLFSCFLVYWLLVFIFFRFGIQYAVSLSFLVALYHLYLCYSVKKNDNL